MSGLSRRSLLGAAARPLLPTDQHAVLSYHSYHFPWPGLGHMARDSEGYAWVPVPMNVTTLG